MNDKQMRNYLTRLKQLFESEHINESTLRQAISTALKNNGASQHQWESGMRKINLYITNFKLQQKEK